MLEEVEKNLIEYAQSLIKEAYIYFGVGIIIFILKTKFYNFKDKM